MYRDVQIRIKYNDTMNFECFHSLGVADIDLPLSLNVSIGSVKFRQ